MKFNFRLLVIISLLLPIALGAMEKGKRKRPSDEFMEMELVEQQPSSVEISKQSPFVPLPDEILVNILGNLITNDPDETLQNIRNATLTNQQFHNLINDKQFTKLLIQKLATNIPGKDELDIARTLQNMPGVQSKEVQEWLAQRKKEIPLENQLIEAAQNGDLSTVKELINKKVNVNAREKYFSNSALIMAAQDGFTSIVETLLAAGADPNLQTIGGSSALIRTVRLAHCVVPEAIPYLLALIEQLLTKGANVDHQDKQKHTALMWAAFIGNKAIVEKLLKAGANPNLIDETGATALTEARESQSQNKDAVIKLLKEYGAQ